MEGRIRYLNRVLKGHDSLLFVQEVAAGRLDVYRKSSYGDHPPYLIFSLTDSWQLSGRPVEWGVDVIINRIKAHDLWRDETIIDKLEAEHEEVKRSEKRARQNSVESFLLDFRRQFAKATDGINTGTLNKTYKGGH